MMTAYMEGSRPASRIGGTMTALITPFADDLVDAVALAAHVEWQILNGVDGLVACGITGEGAVLTMAERSRVISTCIGAAAKKVPVIAASGTNCTATTIWETRQAAALGADAALVTLPYYSKPTQKGIVNHFELLAASTDLPLIVYNQPSHTAADLTPATLQSLASIPSIIAIADGTGDISRIAGWRRLLPDRIALFSTHDPTASAATLAGTQGAISSAANVTPRLFSAMLHAVAAGNLAAMSALDTRLRPLFQALPSESEPAAVKHALHILRGMRSDVRLPLVGVDLATDLLIREALVSVQGGCERRITQIATHGSEQRHLSL
jgi:4-hydroxy-tetrahydrodipicolinate synthase